MNRNNKTRYLDPTIYTFLVLVCTEKSGVFVSDDLERGVTELENAAQWDTREDFDKDNVPDHIKQGHKLTLVHERVQFKIEP